MLFRLLVVDSSEDAKAFYQGIFKNVGHTIRVTASLKEGQELLAPNNNKNTYHLIVIDENVLPEKDRNWQEIRSIFETKPVLFLIQSPEDIQALSGFVDPNIFIFPKPYKPEVLREKIDAVQHWVMMKNTNDYRKTAVTQIHPFTKDAHIKLALDNNPDHIPLAIHYILNFLEDSGASEDDLFRVKLGLTETIINAVAHGNLQMSSTELKGTERNFDRWEAELAKRSVAPEFRDKRVHIQVNFVANDQIVVMIEDEGDGFDIAKVLDVDQQPTEIFDSFGRGLRMVQALSDNLDYNDKGNRLTIYYNCQTESS